jgi:hypothetical protein
MSHLQITSPVNTIVNPEFCKTFIDIAEDPRNAPPPAELDAIPAFANLSVDDELNQRVVSMAKFMLDTGCVLGVFWGEFYYFGDVDRMDNESSEWEDEALILQYCIEDEESFLCPWCSTTGFHDSSVKTWLGEFCQQFCADEAETSYIDHSLIRDCQDIYTNAANALGKDLGGGSLLDLLADNTTAPLEVLRTRVIPYLELSTTPETPDCSPAGERM